jgi:hypothetical protein
MLTANRSLMFFNRSLIFSQPVSIFHLQSLIKKILNLYHTSKALSSKQMISTSQYTNNNSFMQEDLFFESNFDIDIMDDTELFDGVDPLFSFDIFESSETYEMPLDSTERRLSLTFARRLSITSIIHEDQEYQVESRFPVSPPAILSLLNSDQLEKQLEATKARLAESMERSVMSRKRLNDEVNCIPEDQYSRPKDRYKVQRSNSAPASVLSQSRARFASYMISGTKNISSRTL